MGWLCFEREGELLGVAIVEASSLAAARLRVYLDRICPQTGVAITGHELEPRCRAVLNAGETGRMLSLTEAANLLERFDRAAGKKPPAPSVRRLRAMAQARWTKQ